MKAYLAACVKELKSPATTHVAAVSAGTIMTAILHRRVMGNGRVLDLGKDGYDALVNEGVNFVRFSSDKHEHAFRVYLEQ